MNVKLNVKEVLKLKKYLQEKLKDEVFKNTEKFHEDCLLALVKAMPSNLSNKKKNEVLERIYATNGTFSYIGFSINVYINKKAFLKPIKI